MATYESIKIRRDSTLNWYASNPRLELGELGIDMDLHRMKAGNGIDRWNQLPYLNDDAYTLLNRLGQNLTDTAQDIRHVIENNKLDAEQKIADMRQDFRNTDASLTSRMKAVETRQNSYEEELTSRQDEYESGLTIRQEGYERELTGRQDEYENEVNDLVSGMRTELDSGLEDFDDTKDKLTTRMDVIAGQTTEDTEILDARVDAENETHPNLGHNIRNLHSLILSLNDDAGNLRNLLADLNSDLDSAKGDLESLIEEKSTGLQEEIDAEIETREENYTELSQRINDEISERENSISLESIERKISDDGLHEQISLLHQGQDNLSEAVIKNTLSSYRRFTGQSEKLDAEIEERKTADLELSQRIDVENTERENAIAAEAETRNSEDIRLHDAITAEVETRSNADTELSNRLDNEIAERDFSDAEQTERLNHLDEVTAETQSELTAEEHLRRDTDEIISNALNELGEGLITEIISRANESRQVRLQAETEREERINEDNLLQGQLNDETSKREQVDTEHAEKLGEHEVSIKNLKDLEATTNRELNYLGEGLIAEMMSRVEDNQRIRSEIAAEREAQSEALTQEQNERIAGDIKLQEELEATSRHSKERDIEILHGLDEVSEGLIQTSITIEHEADQRRKLERVVAGIKSPVDWSEASSVQIPEPRCAVLNITGITSMPTSKTAEKSAVMEFWDMQGNYFRKKISCSAQGNSSMSYPKKNVKFDLLNEDGSEFEMKIGNWPVQDSFHLKAFYTDFFRGVGEVSYKVCDEIMRFNGILSDRPYKKVLLDMSNIKVSGTALNNPDDLTLQTDTGALCHPDGFPCIMYLNGTFYGIFAWQIKKHRANYHLTKSTVEHIHLDGTLSTANFWNGTINWGAFEIRNPNKLYTMDGKKYDGDAPKELIDESSEKYDPYNKDHVRSAQVKGYIKSLVSRFGEFKQKPTREKYEEIFDWENQRDYLIFSDVIKNSDGFSKNWQWFTYDGLKWFVGAYDLDMSYGGHWQGITISATLSGHITTSTAIPTGYMSRLYNAELEERYRELRDAGIIDAEHIVQKLEDWTQRISTENYELEYERWPNSPCILKYTDSIYRVRKWLDTEIANMDKVYHYVPYETQKQTELRTEFQTQIDTERAEREREVESLNVYTQMESKERESVDVGVHQHINTLSELVIGNMLELEDIKSTLKEWVKAANVIYEMAAETGELTYRGARIASGNAISSMLSDVLSGADTGEVSESDIPEELKDQITTPEEVSAMLSEVFSH